MITRLTAAICIRRYVVFLHLYCSSYSSLPECLCNEKKSSFVFSNGFLRGMRKIIQSLLGLECNEATS